ncbi:MAG TPA: MnmC family methyltransferase [Methanobacteriaceae archaeon]|nr:MnmC family methyltransferase [Methanobacteriaceae archaeon]
MKKETNYSAVTPHQEVLDLVKRWFKAEQQGNKNARKSAKEELEPLLTRTSDGSFTLPSREVGGKVENMHSIHGAIQEAKEKFARPARIHGREEVRILDLCSGLGYNAAAGLDEVLSDYSLDTVLLDDNYDGVSDKDELLHGNKSYKTSLSENKLPSKIEIDLVEILPETLAVALLINPPLKVHALIRRAIEDHLITEGFLRFHEEELSFEGKEIHSISEGVPSNTELPSNTEKQFNINIRINTGDARLVVKNLKGPYHAVFLDPFSPTKSPELFTVEFLSELARLLSSNGLLLTYTAAAPVRSALLEAGLEVGEGPPVGRRGGTVSSHSLKVLQSLKSDDERMISLSDVGIPFHDPHLTDNPETIKRVRKKEREAARNCICFPSTARAPLYLNNEPDDPKLERRIKRQINQMGIDDLNSSKARYLVCPQYDECICHCGQGKYEGSRERIMEMRRRLGIILKDNEDLNDDKDNF